MRIIQPPFISSAVALTHYTLDVDTAAFTVIANSVGLAQGYKLQAASSAFTVTVADIPWESFVITVADVLLETGNRLEASSESFTVAGSAVTFGRTYQLNIDPAAFIVSGTDVALDLVNDLWFWGNHEPILWGDDDEMEL